LYYLLPASPIASFLGFPTNATLPADGLFTEMQETVLLEGDPVRAH